MKKNIINLVNWLDKYDSLISSIATFGSFLAAFFSFVIALMVFQYTKNKDSLNIILNFNRNEISKLYDISKNDMYAVVNDLKFQIENPSTSASNTLFINFSGIKTFNTKKLYKNCRDNKEFSFLGGDVLTIKKLQERPDCLKQKTNINSEESKDLHIPHFILEDLIQASYLSLIGNSEPFEFKRKFKINVTFYNKQRNKLGSKNKKIKYTIKFDGTRQLLHFEMKPVSIRLFK
ncbi:hypothetical protein [Staphylococcus saprophyticus]|uniref:hypothetical protein n=1 Tax=Staphylococcus saprophyticus TaxID=29385 RepID=UPI0008530EEB|nr:hypothetical protein [Staphylococcus saprophyticus]OEK41782.1 hypothetical protein ASS88_07395 [Staphylococcus saprophyticus]